MIRAGWSRTTLGEATHLQFGFAFKSAAFSSSGEGVRLLRGDNIGQARLRWENAKYWSSVGSDIEQYLLATGDVVLAMDRPWIEAGLKYAVVRDQDLPSLLVQRVARIRPSDQVTQGFIQYVLGSPAFTDHVLAVQTGTAVPHISGGQIRAFEFFLPPLDEQRRIAEVLGAIDDLIDSNERTITRLNSLATLLCERAESFAKDSTPLSDCVIATVGGAWGEDAPFDGSKMALSVRGIDVATLAKAAWVVPPVRHLSPTQLSSRVLEPGDLIIEASGTNCGRIWVPQEAQLLAMPLPVTFSNFCKRFKLRPGKLGPRFAQHLLARAYKSGRVSGFRTGSAMPNLDIASFFENTTVPVGPSVTEVEGSLELLDATAFELELERQSLKRTRDELLPLLMSGAVRVRAA